MKITAIKTVVVNAQMRNWIFIKVETNEPGLFGARSISEPLASAYGRLRTLTLMALRWLPTPT